MNLTLRDLFYNCLYWRFKIILKEASIGGVPCLLLLLILFALLIMSLELARCKQAEIFILQNLINWALCDGELCRVALCASVFRKVENLGLEAP